MIVLFTDFGLHGPYTGQMKAVLHRSAPDVLLVDLFADAPAGNPKAAAYLLAAYDDWFPAGTVFLCVVDPGVGSARPATIVEADARWYVGPGTACSSWFSAAPMTREAGTSRGSPSGCPPASTGVTCSRRSPRCWRAASRRPVACARTAPTAAPIGPTTSARSSISITTATP
jgi:hypothetical protein